MKLFVNVTQMRVGNVGVNLRSVDTGVAQHGLHTTQVGAVFEQVGGKTMSQSMRSHFFGYTGTRGVFFDHALDTTSSEPTVFGTGTLAVVYKQRLDRKSVV